MFATPLHSSATNPDHRSVMSLVLPAYNEASRLNGDPFRRAVEKYQDRFSKLLGENEFGLVVVDDGSTDGTADLATKLGARVLQHDDGNNHGKGAAVRLGLLNTAVDATYCLYTDADGSYSPDTIEEILNALVEGCDVATVHRASGEELHSGQLRHVGHTALSRLCELLATTGVTDVQAGAKGFTADAVLKIWPSVMSTRLFCRP
jgi:glycosyltransferase involved in cell wall biosynthesis